MDCHIRVIFLLVILGMMVNSQYPLRWKKVQANGEQFPKKPPDQARVRAVPENRRQLLLEPVHTHKQTRTQASYHDRLPSTMALNFLTEVAAEAEACLPHLHDVMKPMVDLVQGSMISAAGTMNNCFDKCVCAVMETDYASFLPDVCVLLDPLNAWVEDVGSALPLQINDGVSHFETGFAEVISYVDFVPSLLVTIGFVSGQFPAGIQCGCDATVELAKQIYKGIAQYGSEIWQMADLWVLGEMAEFTSGVSLVPSVVIVVGIVEVAALLVLLVLYRNITKLQAAAKPAPCAQCMEFLAAKGADLTRETAKMAAGVQTLGQQIQGAQGDMAAMKEDVATRFAEFNHSLERGDALLKKMVLMDDEFRALHGYEPCN